MKNKQIQFDPNDLKGMKKLMAEYGNSKYPFEGTNENGEDIDISISEDNITVRTFQENGRVRLNTYWNDGTCEEMFEG